MGAVLGNEAYTVLPLSGGQQDEGPAPGSFEALTTVLNSEQRQKAEQWIADVNEVETGYKSGSVNRPVPGEPRPQYDPSRTGIMERYEAKAAERGVSLSTVRNHVRSYRAKDAPGLIDGRSKLTSSLFHACHPRWLEVAEEVISGRTLEPTVSMTTLRRMISARFRGLYGMSIPEPGRTSAFRALAELDAERDTFGDAALRRSKAGVPPQAFGHFRAARPGQYVLLDTMTIDMFTLDPITLSPCRLEVTAAMDLYSRCILGLRVATESTKSIDVSSVLFEMIHPRQAPSDWPKEATWPYHGVPEAVIYQEHDSSDIRFTGPGIFPDAIVTDHGRIFVSAHIIRSLQDLGISIYPARKYTPTDKSPLERWFETLQGALQILPGYAGKDPNAAGASSTKQGYFLPSQLERMIREYTALTYHLVAGTAEADDETPGVHISPFERYLQGIKAAGHILVPRDPSFAFQLLPERRRLITKAGVSLNGLLYRAPILGKYQGRHTSDHNAKRQWSFRFDPDDLRTIYFQDPEDRKWHTIPWERNSSSIRPFNAEALALAKSLAKESHVDVDEELLRLAQKWGIGLELSPKDRKAAHRLLARDAELRAALQRTSTFSDPPDPDEQPDAEDGAASGRRPSENPQLAGDEEDYYSEAADLL